MPHRNQQITYCNEKYTEDKTFIFCTHGTASWLHRREVTAQLIAFQLDVPAAAGILTQLGVVSIKPALLINNQGDLSLLLHNIQLDCTRVASCVTSQSCYAL